MFKMYNQTQYLQLFKQINDSELLVTITLEIAHIVLIVSLDNGGPKMLPERRSL